MGTGKRCRLRAARLVLHFLRFCRSRMARMTSTSTPPAGTPTYSGRLLDEDEEEEDEDWLPSVLLR